MRKTALFLCSVFILIILMSCQGLKPGNNKGQEKESERKMGTAKFNNPIANSGGDPWVIKHGDIYYYCFTAGTGVVVSKVENIHLLSEGVGSKVYTAPEGTMYSKEYWAPELHYIDGTWYIYVAASDGLNDNHRMYVLRALTDDPQGPFEMVGKISDPSDKWAIDGTVFQYDGELYFVWSGWKGDTNVQQNLYIAHMSNPWTIDSDRVLLSFPEYNWERSDYPVNEGPAALIKGDALHIVYSANASWKDNYCLGLLTYRGGEILDPTSWEKSKEPVFSKTEHAYGPGHCSFTKSIDDSTDWIVYHANLASDTGWAGRSIRTQPFTWEDDKPVFGSPVSLATELEIPAYVE